MPNAVTLLTGDGKTANFADVDLSLPDTAGGNFTLAGSIQLATAGGLQNPVVAISGTVAAPAVPGSGSTWSVIYADQVAGTLGISSSNVSLAAALAAVPAGKTNLFTQVLPTGTTTTLSLQGGWTPILSW